MSKPAIKEACTCMLENRPEVWQCPRCHGYRKGSRKFVSISRVKSTVLPDDYSGISKIVLECARLRGSFVDQYFCEWLRDPLNVIPLSDVPALVAPEFPEENEKHAEDTKRRIEMVMEWWQKGDRKATGVQTILYSETDETAGAFDFATADVTYDLKCVSRLQPSYELQLGAYEAMDKRSRERVILHVQKDRLREVRYDAQRAKSRWLTALAWFRVAREFGYEVQDDADTTP